jgi:hypothetical protein
MLNPSGPGDLLEGRFMTMLSISSYEKGYEDRPNLLLVAGVQ